MALRKKLITLTENNLHDDVVDVIHNANPATISLTDLLFLLRLGKASRNNKLGHLQLEAQWWIKDNWDVIQKRIAKL